MMHFGTLRFIMPAFQSSWCILAHYDPKTDLKSNPKMDSKWTQNETRICSIFGPIFEYFLDNFGGHFGAKNLQANYPQTQEVWFYNEKTTFFVKMT